MRSASAVVTAGLAVTSADLEAASAIADFHAGYRNTINESIDAAHVHAQQMAAALQGQAGDAAVAAVQAQTRVWDTHGDLHAQAATAARVAHGEMVAWNRQLDQIGEDADTDYQAAVERDDKVGAAQVITTYRAQAVEGSTAAAGRVTMALDGKFSDPLSPPTGEGHGGQPRDRKYTKADGSGEKDPDASDAKYTAGDPGHDGSDVSTASGNGTTAPDGGKYTAGSGTPSAPSAASASPLSSAASSLPSAGASSLGSSMHAPSMSSPLSSLSSGLTSPGLTSPASAASGAQQVPRFASPGNLGGALQSGFLQGSSAASAAPVIPPAGVNPQGGFFPQPAALTPAATAGPVAGPPPAAAGPLDTAPASAPPVVPAAGGSMGGAPMMVAPSGGGQLSPYTMPGGSAVPPTAAAASSGPSVQASPPVASGAAPLMAGTGGAVSAAAAVRAVEENPDMFTAMRVMADLVHGTDRSGVVYPVSWAAAVLRAASGAYTFVASSAGGGSYLPAQVYLPYNVQLAVVTDPRLPTGWADRFVGCQQPSVILASQFEELREHVMDLRVSALVTSEMQARRPLCGGTWKVLSPYEVQHLPGEAPQVDGWHRHRLAVTEPGVWSRLQTIDGIAKPETAAALAVAITTAVLTAAAEADDETGQPLAIGADETLWNRVKTGVATAEDWQTWHDISEEARDLPEGFAVADADSSAVSAAMRVWYEHWFRAARLVEMLECWDAQRPLNGVADVIYTAVAAGFPDQVAKSISESERRHG